ncbi:HAMP domain-containing protein [Aromatoleum diolicum]|uniref:histidine kinase n=1 Tax=Aromatoleum diolicum TaxID=75796 RepID=A0ABX1Q790_9RHOO|nr:HAMP domain-containing sensor histidine kinase [Aromatoleum diolicum]NMG73262.1 HAMP domain-containing protein [Aromatoleum diolicum]
MNFRDISFRYKIPLRATVLVFLTASVLTASLLLREYRDLRRDMLDSSARWSAVLSQTLVSPMLHDDLWRAFEIIRAATSPGGGDQAGVITLVDPRERIYVSTDPARYPILLPLHERGDAAREIASLIDDAAGSDSRSLEIGDRLYVITPIDADGVRLGHMILEHTSSFMQARFAGMWLSATLVTLVVLLLILPVSWYWGRRMADPLVHLADCIGQVGTKIPDADAIRLEQSQDELGQVGRAVARMLDELREKQALEHEMMFSERLAAIGRLTGGIAHEINNPLGGMLNAISTYRRHGSNDPELAARTMSLLERGLLQIRDTVSALLVEAKAPSHPLGPQDIEDVHILLKPEAAKKSAALLWNCDLPDEIPLPATLVRQVLINLVLNALHAVEPGGTVACDIGVTAEGMTMAVRNDGRHIEASRLPYLFEPFVGDANGGHGLGLWITYQIVNELDGHISVQSEPGLTVFAVELPLRVALELESPP